MAGCGGLKLLPPLPRVPAEPSPDRLRSAGSLKPSERVLMLALLHALEGGSEPPHTWLLLPPLPLPAPPNSSWLRSPNFSTTGE